MMKKNSLSINIQNINNRIAPCAIDLDKSKLFIDVYTIFRCVLDCANEVIPTKNDNTRYL
jgi:hypothetical protein